MPDTTNRPTPEPWFTLHNPSPGEWVVKRDGVRVACRNTMREAEEYVDWARRRIRDHA